MCKVLLSLGLFWRVCVCVCLQVQATDADAGENGRVLYRILSGNKFDLLFPDVLITSNTVL